MKQYPGFILVFTAFLLLSCHQSEDGNSDSSALEVSQRYQDAAAYNVQLGLGYLKQDNMPRAKKKLLTALSQAPNSPMPYAAMAFFMEKTGDLKEAAIYYQKAMSLAPGGGAQLNNYGAFLCRQGQVKEAEQYFLRAVEDKHYEHSASAYENAGLCALSVKDYAKAAPYFKKALAQDPMSKQSLKELVRIKMNEQQYQDALVYLQKYPMISLQDKQLLNVAAQLANKTGKTALEADYRARIQRLNDFPTTTE